MAEKATQNQIIIRRFKPGDCVQLRSGGPLLTVIDFQETVRECGGTAGYRCLWFDTTGLMHDQWIYDIALTPQRVGSGGDFMVTPDFIWAKPVDMR